jgi:hypothetical protein
MIGPVRAVLDPAGPVMTFALADADADVDADVGAEPASARAVAVDIGEPRVPAEALAKLLADHAGPIGVLADDAWSDGTAAGARASEELRRSLVDDLGHREIHWVARAAAAVAGTGGDGVHLICEAGYRSVTLVRCVRVGQTVHLEAIMGDRWRFLEALGLERQSAEFPAAVRDASPLAAEVLARARRDPDFRDTRAYRVGGQTVTAGAVIDAFAPVEARLRAATAELLGGRPPDRVLTTGPLAALPLFGFALPGGTATPVEVRTLLRGALDVAAGRVRVREPDRPNVALPIHRIRRGLLETEKVFLDPAVGPYARLDDEPLMVELDSRLEVEVDGRSREITPAGLKPGRYEVGLRTAHRGAGTLVLRGGTGDDLLFHPLDELRPPDDEEPPS